MQTYTSELWKGSLAHWPGWRILLFISTFFICPPLWLIFALPLNNKYNKTPIVKFGCYLTSHLFFMVVQVLTACIPIYPIYRESLAPYWIEWLLLIWLSGLLLGELISPQDKSGLGRIKILIILLNLVSFSMTAGKLFITHSFEIINAYSTLPITFLLPSLQCNKWP